MSGFDMKEMIKKKKKNYNEIPKICKFYQKKIIKSFVIYEKIYSN